MNLDLQNAMHPALCTVAMGAKRIAGPYNARNKMCWKASSTRKEP